MDSLKVRFALLMLATALSLTSPHPHPVYLYEGSSCTLSHNRAGVCRQVSSCPSAVEQLQNHNSNQKNGMHSFTRCGFDRFQEIVCCPDGYRDQVIVQPEAEDEFQFTDWLPNGRPMHMHHYPGVGVPIATKTGGIRKADQACEQYSKETPSPLELYIIGGEAARQGEFPHMAALGYEREAGVQFECGGTLISPLFVLTAAHCVVTLDGIQPIIARIGTISLTSSFDSSDTDYMVQKIIVHPSYKRALKYNDLALIQLSRPVTFTGDAHPACLYTTDDDPPGTIIVTGWGQTSLDQSNSQSKTLLKANLTAIPIQECNPMYTETRDRKLPNGITPEQICAVDRGGNMDACRGDSGGPIQIPTRVDGMFKVVGVTSFGKSCGDAIPAIYVRVSKYLDWIESVVWP